MFSIIPDYFYWHYRYGGKDVQDFFKNIVWFLWNFFSVGLLMKTLFVPWQRLREYGRKGDLWSYVEAFIITTLMRIIGAGMRLIFITIGIIATSIVLVIGIVVSLVWFIIPLLMVGGFITGIVFLFI
ncbi:MAG: hypothetical protein WC629_00835 [Candidatus Paceibacterota bacterium]|jgi:hypothetical protein